MSVYMSSRDVQFCDFFVVLIFIVSLGRFVVRYAMIENCLMIFLYFCRSNCSRESPPADIFCVVFRLNGSNKINDKITKNNNRIHYNKQINKVIIYLSKKQR